MFRILDGFKKNSWVPCAVKSRWQVFYFGTLSHIKYLLYKISIFFVNFKGKYYVLKMSRKLRENTYLCINKIGVIQPREIQHIIIIIGRNTNVDFDIMQKTASDRKKEIYNTGKVQWLVIETTIAFHSRTFVFAYCFPIVFLCFLFLFLRICGNLSNFFSVLRCIFVINTLKFYFLILRSGKCNRAACNFAYAFS